MTSSPHETEGSKRWNQSTSVIQIQNLAAFNAVNFRIITLVD